jgi:hypothetical protein
MLLQLPDIRETIATEFVASLGPEISALIADLFIVTVDRHAAELTAAGIRSKHWRPN